MENELKVFKETLFSLVTGLYEDKLFSVCSKEHIERSLEDQIELDVLGRLHGNMMNIYDTISDDFPAEIFMAWVTIQTHNILIEMRKEKEKDSDDKTLAILDDIANSLFLRILQEY